MTTAKGQPFDAEATAQVLRAQGHKPDAEDLDRLRRMMAGELSVEGAYAEIDAQVASWCAASGRREVSTDDGA